MTIGQTYRIGGPAVETRVRNDIFRDRVYWEEDDLVLLKVNVKHGYDILVRRRLTQQGLAVTQTVRFRDPNRPDVVMTQLFKRA
mmetsp:Transcript_321/g.977  ORF Transcript_321/g.977 Transcript_321/m.977 type:complete len:84 (+) Transcript_321:526-777(+)